MEMKRILVILMAAVMLIGCTLMCTGCGNSAEMEALTGEYQDSVSQRASMTITVDDDNELEIKVFWSDSAEQTTEWDMEGVLKDGKIEYSECEKEVQTYDEDGKLVNEQESDLGAGYFEVSDDGTISWTGAEETECQECVFERAE